ncbi:MAG TPA: hypothetical protein DDW76_15985 [Cyanobacteria bacterium UBA11369]|nr:hypothetical protein [Cyanobacteria bacterium UBA11371]HBE36780.1 hypothetical protein [Cyanobacteria bacterium UBA11368]HBE50249.1 hypothetical protein [Cyanobacteria bacterium UBA11369]
MLENFFDLTTAPDTFTVSSANTLGLPIRGLGGNDFIVGSSNADVILGNTGADIIYGLDGADTLYGGRGADLLFGNKGADWLLGERGNDVIFGGRGNDSLSGGEGDDFLAGDGGIDTLTGDDGSDAFVLDIRHSTSDRTLVDIITDFSKDDDVLALTDGANDALTEADVTLETVGTDTFISLKSTGAFLAQVQGATAAQIAGTFSTVRSTLDDTEPGATILGLIPGQVTVQEQVGNADYLDMFQFEVAETSIVDFSLTGLSADADLALYQDLDDDGEVGENEIISASVRSDNADETIENVTLDRGKYFLSVEQFEGDTNYNLSVAGVAGTVARDLAGDRPSTARTLPPDGEVELHDYVGGTDGVDTYRLEVLNGGYLDLFTDYPEAAVNLTLWSDRNGNNQLDVDEIVAYETNEMQQDFIDSGTYYVSVTAPGDPTPYKITGIASLGSRVDIENYNPLFPGIPTTGSLSQNDDSDPIDPDNYADPYLLPELGAGLTVTVTQKSEDFDAYLRVVDLITGEAIAENDDIDTASGNYDAEVSFTTEQGGQYVVYASSVDAPGIGDYTLDATVTGTVTQTSLSSASTSNDHQLELLPEPVWREKGDRADTGLQQDTLHEFVYKPLTGGNIAPIQIKYVNQNLFGNCAFLAALTATFGKIEDPTAAASAKSEVLKNAIEDNGNNNYTLTFYDYVTGEEANVTVDNQVVIKDFPNNKNLFGAKWDNKPVTFDQASGKPIWGSIFERAYAKWRGQQTGDNGYDVTGNGDWGGIPLRRVTGKAIQEISWNPSQSNPTYSLIEYQEDGNYKELRDGDTKPDQIFKDIETALDQNRYVMAGTISDAEQRSGGVVIGSHAYSIHNAYEANNQKMILVRNPWGKDTRSGAVDDLNDGFVTLTFNEFLKNFDGVSLSQK